MGLTNFIVTVAGVSAVILLMRSDVKQSASIFKRNVRQIRHWLEEESTHAANFLKGRNLWRYVTGDIQAPTQGAAETPTEFIVRMEEYPSGYVLVILPIFHLSRSTAPYSVLMGLSDIYELVRASLLHCIPLPTLEQAISELLSEETHLGLVSISHWPLLLLLLVQEDVAPLVVLVVFLASDSQSSGGSASRPNECTFCHATLTIACSLVLFGFTKPIASEVLPL
ncbi:hypothetical protein Acr_27g0008860 [Actinidia rufa]|uniref:Uncharacterized protein n=1 Tax=Actinidia rufa TaxID=165716 RepID=A0A7J0H7Q4_9ERIC|nr:hypothetical protein Acr_27g0008860 [Actinidia rufa]